MWSVPLILLTLSTFISAPPKSSVATDGGREEAVAFIACLDDAQRSQALRPINDPDRAGWTYVAGPREGLRIGDLAPDQMVVFRSFLKGVLSSEGIRRVDQVCAVEPVEDRGGGVRTGPGEYWIRFYGVDSDGRSLGRSAWAWRLEGHHLVLNSAVVDGEVISITPFFLGAAPIRGSASSPESVRGIEPLRVEDEKAWRLFSSLRADGFIERIDPNPPGDIRSGTGRRADEVSGQGVSRKEMTSKQQKLLDSVVAGVLAVWPKTATSKLRERMSSVDSSKVLFFWSGDYTRSGPHYWRVASPAVLLEYVNVSAGANHAHLVLRTLHDEFPLGSSD